VSNALHVTGNDLCDALGNLTGTHPAQSTKPGIDPIHNDTTFPGGDFITGIGHSDKTTDLTTIKGGRHAFRRCNSGGRI